MGITLGIAVISASLLFLSACATSHRETTVLSPAPWKPDPAQPVRLSNLHEPFMGYDLQFARQSDALDAKLREAVSRNARLILRYQLRFRIVGHADDCNDKDTDQHLSERRAENVRRELLALSVPADLIESVSGLGSDRPLLAKSPPCNYPNHDRVELNLVDLEAPEHVAPANPDAKD